MSSKLYRRTVVKNLLSNRNNNILVVTGLGGTSWDVTALGDNDLNFILWGGMGNASMVGLGLALAQPNKKIIVITGDGEMLMGLGSLATIAVKNPNNLSIVVLDNELYGETGGQKSHTAYSTNLSNIALAAGIKSSHLITNIKEVNALRKKICLGNQLVFAQIKISKENGPMILPPREGSYIKNRFRKALLGPNAFVD